MPKHNLNEAQLKQYIENLLIPHSAFQGGLEKLEKGYKLASLVNDPIGYFISGESRSGKSRLIEEFRLQHPSTRTSEGMNIPIIYVEVPSKPTVKGLASSLLDVLGDPLASKGTEQQMTHRLLKLLKECNTQVMILDEFQHFVDKSSKFVVIHHVSDWLKNLISKAKIITVLAGLPYGQTVLSQNEQLRGRFTSVIEMPRFEWEDPILRGEFLGILDGFTGGIKKHFRIVELGEEGLGYRFFIASGGLVGYVCKILRQAAWNAVDANRKIITLEDLELAYLDAVHPDDRQSINPFSKMFSLVSSGSDQLVKVGLRAIDYGHTTGHPRYKPRSTREALAA